MQAKEQNLFQSFFRNELTWFAMIIAAVYGVFVTIVLPLNTLTVQFIQFQAQNIAQTKAYTLLTAQVETLTVNQQVDEEKINQLENHIYIPK